MVDFTNFATIPLAHRGLHDEKYDENSLSAFKAAVDHGYGIELDVHLLKDGTIAVVHDNDLSRVTGVKTNVSEMNAEQLAKTSLLVSKEPIPTLNDVLKVVNGKVPLLIEMKVDGKFDSRLPKTIINLLKDYPKTNNIAIESFNPYAIRWLSVNHPNKYSYGQLVSHHLENISSFANWMFSSLFIRFISKPSFLAFDVNYLPNRALARLRRKGVHVISWTIDSETKRQLAKKETENYIFESIRP